MFFDENGKKIDGRKFNGGNKGCGRKPKAYETKLAEKLEPHNDEIIKMMIDLALKGDKDMIKLYMGYLHGNPKVKTENETSVSVSEFKLSDLITFKRDDSYLNDEDFDL